MEDLITVISKDYGKHGSIDFDTAQALINAFGGYGSTRVYGTFRDGVYKGQIASIKSLNQLDELISVYNLDLTACTSNNNINIEVYKVK